MLEPLESRVLFSHVADAPSSTEGAPYLGNFSKRHRWAVTQSIGGKDNADTYSFTIGGDSDRIIKAKITAPGKFWPALDIFDAEGSFVSVGKKIIRSETVELPPGQYYIVVGGGKQIMNYRLSIVSSLP